MKKLIHLRIPLDDNYRPIIEYDFAKKIRDDVQANVRNNYIVIISPFYIESTAKRTFGWILNETVIAKFIKHYEKKIKKSK